LKLIDKLPEIIKAHSITGSDSWLLEILVRDVEHLDAMLWALKTLTDTSTTVVLRTPREHGIVLPPRDADELLRANATSAAKRKRGS
jgi:Lrp/AsnC family transcriptional regulator, leucine-responsive regulatory protein